MPVVIHDFELQVEPEPHPEVTAPAAPGGAPAEAARLAEALALAEDRAQRLRDD